MDAVVILSDADEHWAAWDGNPGGPLLPRAMDAPQPTPAEVWARNEVAAAHAARRAGKDHALVPAVVPPPGHRTCGTTRAGGGLGWHIVRNAGDVWQRIEWVRPPTAPEVLALPPDGYPIADARGALCAWGRQQAPRTWQIVVGGTSHVVDALPNHEHPPARCLDGGGVVVDTVGGSFVYTPDGRTEPFTSRVPQQARIDRRELIAGATARIDRPKGSLRAHLGDGTVVELALPEDRDLAGRPLTPGTIRERVLAAGDPRDTFLLAERLTLPNCTAHEVLVRWNATTRDTRLLREGDIVFSRLSFGYRGFWWLESSPRLVDVSGAQLD